MALVEIVAVNVGERIAILATGEAFPLLDFYDADGDDVDDADEAVLIVGRISAGVYVTIDMREFVDAPLN